MEHGSDNMPPQPLSSARFQVFSALQYRDYRLFWVGNAFSNLGIWILMAGRLWLMRDLTRDYEASALWLGLVTFSGLAPILLLSMWGGVVADRVNRVRFVTFTRAMFSLTALLTAALIILDVILPWHLIAISLANGVLLSFDIPCRQAIVPNLVRREHLLNAVVLQSFLGTGAAVIGPTLFAPMVNSWGLEGLFLFVGVAYALTVVMFAMVRSQAVRQDARKQSVWDDLLVGLSYIRAHAAILKLIAIGVVAGVFGASFGTLLPIFADQILSGGLESYGALLLGAGLGGLTGALALATLGKLKSSTLLQLATGVGFGLGLALFSQITWLPASIAVIWLVGACSVAFSSINNALIQGIVADEVRGRVMSIHQLGWGASAIGGLVMGTLAQAVSAPFALMLAGTVMAAATAALSLSAARNIRAELLAGTPGPAHDAEATDVR
jgi:MFS family permease